MEEATGTIQYADKVVPKGTGGVMKIVRFQWQDKVKSGILEGDIIFALDGKSLRRLWAG